MQISKPDYCWKNKKVIRPSLVFKSKIILNYDAIQINDMYRVTADCKACVSNASLLLALALSKGHLLSSD